MYPGSPAKKLLFQVSLTELPQREISGALFQLFLKTPSQRTPFPTRFPNGAPMETPASRALCYTHLSLKVLGKRAPSMFPNRVPMERDAPSLEPVVNSFISGRVPSEGALPQNGGKHTVTVMEPHEDGRPTYNGVQPSSSRGLFATLLSLPQCHVPFSMIPSTLAWVDQSPVSQRVL